MFLSQVFISSFLLLVLQGSYDPSGQSSVIHSAIRPLLLIALIPCLDSSKEGSLCSFSYSSLPAAEAQLYLLFSFSFFSLLQNYPFLKIHIHILENITGAVN